MGSMSVIRTNQSLVKPAEETPLTTLDLSVIDKIPVLRCDARTLHVFRHGPEAASVIREALSRALVPYYPLAGRLVTQKQEEKEEECLQVQCSGEGVWFVEASADCTLQSVHFFDGIHSIPYHDLLPQTQGIYPLVKMQVTQFGCGGFVIGLVFCHTICDGLGAAQFLNALGELARGLHNPTIQPIWHRHFAPSQLPSPSPSPSIPKLPPPMPSYQLEHANIDIPMHRINNLKQEFQRLTGLACSSFEIVAAGLWTSRTKAIDFEPSAEVKLVFFANCRQILEPPVPAGFYGNCFFPVTITASYESVRDASIFDVVKMIQDAKTKLASEFGKYLKGESEGGEDPFAPPLSYETLFISEWGRLGFNNVDYGWGPPVHVVPIQGSSIIPVGIVGYMPLTLLTKKGIRLMTWCVEQDHRHAFLHQMHALMDI